MKRTKLELNEDDIFSNKYFIINKILLKSVGLWPYQDVWVKRVMRTFLIVCIYSMMIPQVPNIFKTFLFMYLQDQDGQLVFIFSTKYAFFV